MGRIFTLALTILTICSLSIRTTSAQPTLKGCHYSWNNEKLEPLTEKQKAAFQASSERSDSIDIINYDINLEIINFSSRIVRGFTEITFTPKLENVNRIELNLLDFTVDSVYLNGESVPFGSDQLFVTIPFEQTYNPGDNLSVIIWYHGRPTVDPGGFGGLDFRDGIAYNLGIGLGSNPYNYGRGWYPCFDNFVERAAYDFNITSQLPRKAYCSGTFLGETVVSGDTIVRSFRLDQEIPSYLAGVAVGDFEEYNDMHDGLNTDIPVQLLASPSNIQSMINSFADLGGIIDALEYWFGPYAWNRVGFVTTAVGAMEHSENIAFPTSSATDGNTFGTRRLIAHELAHHWWGNVAGIPGPADMWFKEGNAEYGAHLITERLFGREAFLDQVIDNHLEMLGTAHIQDGDFLPLSGIPFENTYGVHTYNKGASMMHNLRGYLGDEGFRTGMTSVQQNLGFASITVDYFRDHLTQVTGTDLVDFFDNWLKSPGWSGFGVQNMRVTPQGDNFQLDIDIQQGLRGATEFHNNVPLHLYIYGADGNLEMADVMVSGELTPYSIVLDFEPMFTTINEEHRLNLAQIISSAEREDPGQFNLGSSGWTVTSEEQNGPVKVWIDQKWFGPQPSTNPDVRFGTRRYWDVQGFGLEENLLSGKIEYRGNSINSFEYDLLTSGEDSLILAYRANDTDEWIEYPNYFKNIIVNPDDGIGNMLIDKIRPGQYCLANGSLPLTSLNTIETYASKIYPNPANDQTQIEIADLPKGDYQIKIYGVLGDELHAQSLKHAGGLLKESLDLRYINHGTYWIAIEGKTGKVLVNQPISVSK